MGKKGRLRRRIPEFNGNVKIDSLKVSDYSHETSGIGGITSCRHFDGSFNFPCNYVRVEGDRGFCGVDAGECDVRLE